MQNVCTLHKRKGGGAHKVHSTCTSYSANIRNMFTRFCIDANCTLDGRYRNFRYKSVEDSLCNIYNVAQSIDHVLLHYKGTSRQTDTKFVNKLCK